jgi:hypothetical protein
LPRFVADCARLEGMDAIKYPSSRCGKGDNLAFLDGERFETVARISAISEYQDKITGNLR